MLELVTPTAARTLRGIIVHIGSSGLVFSLNPFNPALGTLDSFTITWDFKLTVSGVSGPSNPNVGGSYSAGVYVGNVNYSGYGMGLGLGGNAKSSFGPENRAGQIAQTFYPNSADPNILAFVTGNSAFTLSYLGFGGNVATVTYGPDIASLMSVMNVDLMVTYDYTAAAVPEPTSMAIFGLGALGFAYRNRRKLMK